MTLLAQEVSTAGEAITAPRPMADRERGASAVEYGLLVAAIAAVIVAVVFAVGSATGALFQESCESIEAGSTIEGSCPSEPDAVTED